MMSAALRVLSLSFLLASLLTGAGASPLAAQGREGRRWDSPEGLQGSRLTLGYAADGFLPVRGGTSGEPCALDNLDLLVHLDLNQLLGLSGTSVRVHVQSSRRSSRSPVVEALQGLSNLEADPEWRLYEAWIEHQAWSRRLSILAGIRDLNGDFDVIPSTGDFLNGAFGLGPEYGLRGSAGPSTFSTTGLAARIRIEPRPSLYGLFGVSEGIPPAPGESRFSPDPREGGLLSVEIGYSRTPSGIPSDPAPALERQVSGRGRGQPLQARRRGRIGRGSSIQATDTKVALGGWGHTRRLESWSPGEPSARSWGLYFLGERLLRRDQDGTGGISAFARVGTAADAVNRLDLTLRAGVAYLGALPGRPEDVLGLGFAYARNGGPFLRARREAALLAERSEIVLELTYRFEALRFLTVQPDLQWIMSPGMDPALADALAFGLRANVLVDFPAR